MSDEIGHYTRGSRKALGAMNAKLRAKVGRLEREIAELRDRLDVMTQCADNYSRMFEESSEEYATPSAPTVQR